jgi:hypothetical protein
VAVPHLVTGYAAALAVCLACAALPAVAQEPGPQLRLLDAEGRTLDPQRDALGISRQITHDSSLPRALGADEKSLDPDNFRVELSDPRQLRDVVYVRLSAIAEQGERHGLLRHVPLRRLSGTALFRSPFIRPTPRRPTSACSSCACTCAIGSWPASAAATMR